MSFVSKVVELVYHVTHLLESTGFHVKKRQKLECSKTLLFLNFGYMFVFTRERQILIFVDRVMNTITTLIH